MEMRCVYESYRVVVIDRGVGLALLSRAEQAIESRALGFGKVEDRSGKQMRERHAQILMKHDIPRT